MHWYILEKKNEIQYENRLLLKKMLQIDLKPSRLNKKVLLQEMGVKVDTASNVAG